MNQYKSIICFLIQTGQKTGCIDTELLNGLPLAEYGLRNIPFVLGSIPAVLLLCIPCVASWTFDCHPSGGTIFIYDV